MGEMTVTGFVLGAASSAAAVCWLADAVVRVLVPYRSWIRLHRLVRGLMWVGLILALASWAVHVSRSWPNWAPVRAVQLSGLGIAAVAVQAILTRPQRADFAAVLVSGFSIAAQSVAAVAVWWGGSTDPSTAVLPVWMIGRDLAALVAGGALAVCASAVAASFVVRRAHAGQPRRSQDDNGTAHLLEVELTAARAGLVALTLCLSLDVLRSWLGWGEVMRGGAGWLLLAWLLLLSRWAGGLRPASASARVAVAFLIVPFVAVCLAVAGPA